MEARLWKNSISTLVAARSGAEKPLTISFVERRSTIFCTPPSSLPRFTTIKPDGHYRNSGDDPCYRPGGGNQRGFADRLCSNAIAPVLPAPSWPTAYSGDSISTLCRLPKPPGRSASCCYRAFGHHLSGWPGHWTISPAFKSCPSGRPVTWEFLRPHDRGCIPGVCLTGLQQDGCGVQEGKLLGKFVSNRFGRCWGTAPEENRPVGKFRT
jgi:hypothetical protein